MRNKIEKFAKIFLPSVIDVFFIVILLYILVFDAGAHLLRDADTGFHIATGKYFLEHLALPGGDIFSHTVFGQQWLAFSWGTGVVFAIAEKFAGLNGVVLFSVLLILATIFLIYKLLMRWNVSFLVLFISLSIFICLNTVHWLARPHLFTIFFTVLTFYLLELAKENRKLYYFLPLIMLLWANIHPGFISGGFIIIIYFLGNIFEWQLSKNNDLKRTYIERAKLIFISGVVSFIATLINPYGMNLYVYIYKTLTSSWIVNACLEYYSPSFHDSLSEMVYGIIIVAIIVLGFVKSKKILDMPKILLLLLWTYLSLFAMRNIALFAVVAVPCLALILQNIYNALDWKRFKQMDQDLLELEKNLKWHVFPLALIVILFLAALNNGYVLGRRLIKCEFPADEIPVQAMKYVEQNPISGNIYNLDNWGGYIIYKYPHIKVFIDGRLDMYQQKFLGEYQDVVNVTPGWQRVLGKYNVQWVLFSKKTTLYNVLNSNPGWKKVYEDKLSAIFVRNKDV